MCGLFSCRCRGIWRTRGATTASYSSDPTTFARMNCELAVCVCLLCLFLCCFLSPSISAIVVAQLTLVVCRYFDNLDESDLVGPDCSVADLSDVGLAFLLRLFNKWSSPRNNTHLSIDGTSVVLIAQFMFGN